MHTPNFFEIVMSSHASRVLKFVAEECEDTEFVESMRNILGLPKMVPEIRLPGSTSTCNSRTLFAMGSASIQAGNDLAYVSSPSD